VSCVELRAALGFAELRAMIHSLRSILASR